MKNSGKIFEGDFFNSVDKKEIYFNRIKDPCGFGQGGTHTKFTAKNPFDCWCFYKTYVFPMELKSSKSSSFSFQREGDKKSKKIQWYQIKGLEYAQQYSNIEAGFVLNFRDEEERVIDTYWISIDNFKKFMDTTTKTSINREDIIANNGILVSTNLKRTRYSYDIKKLLNDIISFSKERGENNA